MDDLREWIALSSAPGLGPAGFWRLVDHFGSPAAVLNAGPDDLGSIAGLSQSQVSGLSDRKQLLLRADDERERLMQASCDIVTAESPYYPPLLSKTGCPPPLLYVKGDKKLLTGASVGIVGSRAATNYGRRTAFNLARDLAGSGVIIVSGGAVGIDTEAHAGCLGTGGITISVLGCGLDVVYPRTNARLFQQIAEQGVLVSEYPLGTRPEGFRFPARNRIIAGISHGIIVVEAARRSGSLITVQYALEEGREVCAVPGQVDSVKSGGTHWLIRQGATLVVSAEEILESMGLSQLQRQRPGRPDSVTNEIGAEEQRLLDCLESYPVERDRLLRLSGMSSAKLSEHLLMLELEGLVELMPGDEIRKIGRPGA